MTKKQQTGDAKKTAVKTATITLRAQGSTLTLLATAKHDGTAVTTVTEKDAEKKSRRGCTEIHATMDLAKTHLASLAKKAEANGWQRGVRAVATKPDAFNRIPSAPKATA